MANVKITDLAESTTIANSTYLVVDNGTTTKKATKQNLLKEVNSSINTKQDTLVSGTNIKTINSTSLLGSENIVVQEPLISGTNIKTINSNSILGSGNIEIQGGSGTVTSITAGTGLTGGTITTSGTIAVDIIDNLTTDDATKVLSAKQGKSLQDTKININDIIDNVTSTDTDKPLSANQGKVLKELIDSNGFGIDTTNILYNQSGSYGTVLTYTTTQNCVVEWVATNGGSINGVSMLTSVGTMYAKSGVTFRLNGGTTSASRSMRAFGLK